MTNLALKYRPQSFSAVIGQDTAVKAVSNYVHDILDQPHLSVRPLLLCGLHGCGKTTLGRLVAKKLNCMFPDEGGECLCDNCTALNAGTFVDFTEIDAASNNGVDDIRALTELAYTKPLNKFKIFLIDEAHQLSKAANNALLKLLEEPPAGIVYILATTEPQKIMATVKSRCHMVEVYPVKPDVLKSYLKTILTQESLSSFLDEEEILDFVITRGRGSVRDTVKALTEVIATGAVSMEEIHTLFRSKNLGHYEEVLQALLSSDIGKALIKLDELKTDGVKPDEILTTLYELMTDILHYCAGSNFTQLNSVDHYRQNYNVTLTQATTLLGAFLEVENLSFGNITFNLLNYAATKYYLTATGADSVIQSTNGTAPLTPAKPKKSGRKAPVNDMMARMSAVMEQDTPAKAVAAATDPEPVQEEEEDDGGDWF